MHVLEFFTLIINTSKVTFRKHMIYSILWNFSVRCQGWIEAYSLGGDILRFSWIESSKHRLKNYPMSYMSGT